MYEWVRFPTNVSAFFSERHLQKLFHQLAADEAAGAGVNLRAEVRVLLVEDDLMIGQMYVLGLRRAGYDVSLATDGRQALEKMRSVRPHLVLLDIRLPHMDGLEVLAAVKNDEALRATPIVVLSNFGERETVQQARDLGAIDYLNKSNVTPGDLARRLPDWLGESA